VISILTVFAMLMLTALLGMTLNVARQVDGKIRMQNAADAAVYSGTVVLARGMNSLAFTNHLLSDVFALTAFMREARDRHSDKYVPPILAAWTKAGQIFQTSAFPKFQQLGAAIVQKVPMEQNLANAFADWAYAASSVMLPTLEDILRQEMIPTFQRALLQACPDMAQQAAYEAALANGHPDFGRGDMLGVLWRFKAVPVGGSDELNDPYGRTLPVIDPVGDFLADQAAAQSEARQQRHDLAQLYLGVGGAGGTYLAGSGQWISRSWNADTLWMFDNKAKMSQFGALWRGFTCGQLEKLLDEYPDRNLPFLIRVKKETVEVSGSYNDHLDQYFTFVGVAYWRHVREFAARLYKGQLFDNPTQNDAITFAQVRMFLPHRKLRWHHVVPAGSGQPTGGIPGQSPNLPPPSGGGYFPPPDPYPPGVAHWIVCREGEPEGNSELEHWDLLNEHWTVALVPATARSLTSILQTPPSVPNSGAFGFQVPSLAGVTNDDVKRISSH
jgi:hypothetical protein